MNNTTPLIGFNELDKSELEEVEKIIAKSFKKINLHQDPKTLTIELKQHQHANKFIHEINAVLFIKNKRLNAKTTDKNLYKALKSVLDKVINELEHVNKFNKKIHKNGQK